MVSLCEFSFALENFVSPKRSKAARATGKEMMRAGVDVVAYEIRKANDKIVCDKVNGGLIQEVRGWLHFDRARAARFRRA